MSSSWKLVLTAIVCLNVSSCDDAGSANDAVSSGTGSGAWGEAARSGKTGTQE